MKTKKRSPLTDRPLRNPGQSIDERIQNLLTDKFLLPIMIATLLVAFAAIEWWRYYVPQPPKPILVTFMASFATIWAGIRIRKFRPQLHSLRLARDGERAVGQFLERLREDGYKVFHDVIGPGFNLDHVLVGAGGIFTIETKTFSKPVGSDAKVKFDGEHILVNGLKPDRDPVVQARAQARWLRELLSESTGRKFPVRPVILFPGWFVEQNKSSARELWVLNPKALRDFLRYEAEVLAHEDVTLAAFHLSRFIRSAGTATA